MEPGGKKHVPPGLSFKEKWIAGSKGWSLEPPGLIPSGAKLKCIELPHPKS